MTHFAPRPPSSHNHRRIYAGSRSLAAHILEVMAARGITRPVLAQRLACTLSNVDAVTKCRCNFPVDARDRWADALGLSGEDREQFQVMAAFAVLDDAGLREVRRLRELAGVG